MAALILAIQVVRDAAVDMFASLRPDLATNFWADHPAVEISRGLTEIGRAAHDRRAAGKGAFSLIEDAARKAPLSPEPFLVKGVQAQTAGQSQIAERAFVAAQWRDPRSNAAAYFLADYYIRKGQMLQGLEQIALLERLVPGSADVTPFVAAFAQNPANWPQMRALFISQYGLEDQVLSVLARDPHNVEAVLALADSAHRRSNSVWLPTLLQTLVARGDYARAHAIWSSIGGGGHSGDQLLYDSGFSSSVPPPPFNWSLTSSSIGLAERQQGNRLHTLFYGSEDGVLASQLLLLTPGTYQLRMQLVGVPLHPETLRWSIRCDGSTDPVASIRLDEVAKASWTFQVPQGCRAQWLELSGHSGDVAQQSEAVITNLKLTRVASA